MRPLSDLIQQLRSDYTRHGASLKNPAFWAVAVYRFGVWSKGLGDGPLAKVSSKVYGGLFLTVQLTTGIVLNREARIGKDFHLVHAGNTKIHPGVVIGEGCGVMHDVTLGTNMDRGGVPTIGNGVFIGCGAKVLGPITVGDGARIAANSLVLGDVPPGATAVGVPARILRYTGRAEPVDEAPPARDAPVPLRDSAKRSA